MPENGTSTIEVDFSRIDEIVEQNGGEKNGLISMLHDIQAEYNYLPEDALRYLAKKLDVPPIHVYGVASFYSSFSLKPRGRHLCTVCMGTACHVRRSPLVLEQMERKLGIDAGDTTEDGEFTLETVNCLGTCALGPIVVIDGEYHGHTTPGKIDSILKKYSSGPEETD
jgi:NADH-quinone oxidoreductase subunit E